MINIDRSLATESGNASWIERYMVGDQVYREDGSLGCCMLCHDHSIESANIGAQSG